MLCAVCHREGGPFFFRDVSDAFAKDLPACSMNCLSCLSDKFLSDKKGSKMIDKTENEKRAIIAAGKAAGEFLDESGHYDISKMSADQYDQFIECAVTAYTEHLLNILMPERTAGSGRSSEQLPF